MATITVTDLAVQLDTDGRTTRKFLRSITPKDAQPGKGSKWAIEKRDVRSLKSKFAKFQTEAAARAESKGSTKEELETLADTIERVQNEDQVQEGAEVEPSAEDLAAIENEG